MFGTVMISRSSASIDDMRALITAWRADIGDAAGYVDQRALATDDGRLVVCVRFKDRASYEALADLPAQDAWWRANMEPLLQGEVTWIDGEWHDL